MTETHRVGEGPTTTAEALTAMVQVTEGPETAAAVAAQQEVVPQPMSWDDVCDKLEAGELGREEVVSEFVEWVEAGVVSIFGRADCEALQWGVFCGATTNEQSAILRYIIERKPHPETVFLKMQEEGFRPGVAFGDLLPVERAGFEFLARVVPVLLDSLDAVRGEAALRRRADPDPAPTRPVPLEDTSLEQVPGFGEQMER